MKRRAFLQAAGSLTAHSLIASWVGQSFFIQNADGRSVSLESLRRALNPRDAQLLLPNDAVFATYQVSFNRRTVQVPMARALCATPEAVAVCLQWARDNKVPLASRSGGHSYEGFSQSSGLVIDTRPMNQVEFLSDELVSVGAGAKLGEVYKSVATRGMALPCGTCPTVGVTGHTLGGGYGMLARAFGLACDSVESFELIDAQGRRLVASASENQDLNWALRGGGGGSFGVVTRLNFRPHRVGDVVVFGISWTAPIAKAMVLMKAWQQWAPQAPREITCLVKFSKAPSGEIRIRFVGQSIGSESELRRQIQPLIDIQAPERHSMKVLPWIDAVRHFGGTNENPSVLMKGKSDYIKKIMSPESMKAFLTLLPAAPLDVMFDSYGGAISDLKDTETAFAHRENTVSSLQYYVEWSRSADTPAYLKKMKTFHDALRPHMSGAAYVNYCDLDIPDWGRAYWGANFERLKEIKQTFDPENVFKHAQSIPVKRS